MPSKNQYALYRTRSLYLLLRCQSGTGFRGSHAKLGFDPILLPFKPNGKAMHIKRFLARFSKTAKTQREFLNRVAKLNVPLVGVDPAIVLSYRDEYKEGFR